MGLPPLDPRSKSKNMAMKLMNRIGNKQPNRKLHGGEAPKYPGAQQFHSQTLSIAGAGHLELRWLS